MTATPIIDRLRCVSNYPANPALNNLYLNFANATYPKQHPTVFSALVQRYYFSGATSIKNRAAAQYNALFGQS
jgi:hypothetical protein